MKKIKFSTRIFILWMVVAATSIFLQLMDFNNLGILVAILMIVPSLHDIILQYVKRGKE